MPIDEIDFEFAGRGGLDLTMHVDVNGQRVKDSVRLFVGKDMSGTRHKFGIKLEPGVVTMLMDNNVIHVWEKAKMAQFEGYTSAHFARDARDLAFIGTNLGPLPANAAPSAALVAPETAKKGAAVALDASGSIDSDGDALSYVWDFGDGTGEYGSQDQIEHAFRKSGDLTVTLTVVDARGASSSTTSAVSVAKSASDEGFLGCGCTLNPAGTSPRNSLLGALAVIALGLMRLRRA